MSIDEVTGHTAGHPTGHAAGQGLTTVGAVLADTDRRLQSGARQREIWATGFAALDKTLNGGFRAGDLVLLAGPQGLGKTTWMLQVARNVARAGKPALLVSYEHDVEALTIRLLALEAGERGGPNATDASRIRQAFEGGDGSPTGLATRLSRLHSGVEAHQAVTEYANRLVLQAASGMSTGLAAISAAVGEVRDALGEPPVLFVDYLQKVPAPQYLEESERVTHVVEALKDMALEQRIPVVAVVAHDKEGLETGRRLRARHMRGSTALAYEADVLLLMNLKYDIVARHHIIYDIARAENFKDWVVITVEKNRAGQSGVELEFRKRLHQSRFDQEGGVVTEQLVGERVLTD